MTFRLVPKSSFSLVGAKSSTADRHVLNATSIIPVY